MYPALPAEYSANIPPESCPDRRRRRAAPELQTKPAVHCTDPAAPGALPRHLPKLNRSFLAARFDSNTAANENRGSVWSRVFRLLEGWSAPCFPSRALGQQGKKHVYSERSLCGTGREGRSVRSSSFEALVS